MVSIKFLEKSAEVVINVKEFVKKYRSTLSVEQCLSCCSTINILSEDLSEEDIVALMVEQYDWHLFFEKFADEQPEIVVFRIHEVVLDHFLILDGGEINPSKDVYKYNDWFVENVKGYVVSCSCYDEDLRNIHINFMNLFRTLIVNNVFSPWKITLHPGEQKTIIGGKTK